MILHLFTKITRNTLILFSDYQIFVYLFDLHAGVFAKSIVLIIV